MCALSSPGHRNKVKVCEKYKYTCSLEHNCTGSYRAAACGPELISIADEAEAELAEAKLATSLGSCIARVTNTTGSPLS